MRCWGSPHLLSIRPFVSCIVAPGILCLVCKTGCSSENVEVEKPVPFKDSPSEIWAGSEGGLHISVSCTSFVYGVFLTFKNPIGFFVGFIFQTKCRCVCVFFLHPFMQISVQSLIIKTACTVEFWDARKLCICVQCVNTWVHGKSPDTHVCMCFVLVCVCGLFGCMAEKNIVGTRREPREMSIDFR